jgi:hypothetical protein
MVVIKPESARRFGDSGGAFQVSKGNSAPWTGTGQASPRRGDVTLLEVTGSPVHHRKGMGRNGLVSCKASFAARAGRAMIHDDSVGTMVSGSCIGEFPLPFRSRAGALPDLGGNLGC